MGIVSLYGVCGADGAAATVTVPAMSIEIRKLSEDRVDDMRRAITTGFGGDFDPNDEHNAERFRIVFDRDRMFPAFDGDVIIGTGGDFEFDLTVPGGAQVPTAGLTIITVQPTHTRRGVLTMMMREHFARAGERGESLGALWASEATIYGRFGYGDAVELREMEIDARHAGRGGSEPGVTVRLVDLEAGRGIAPEVYDAVQATRPGMYTRTADWWKWRVFDDPEARRNGASGLRTAIAEHDGEVVGYVLYRQKMDWDAMAGEVRIVEMMPATGAGYRALWHFVLNVDLFPIVKYWNYPADDPLRFMVEDGRQVRIKDSNDGIWVRLIDVPDALGRRTYSDPGEIVIGVEDGFCEWNRGKYRLSVDGAGEARCERTDAAPDVVADVSALGSLYLGGRSARAMALASAVRGADADVARLDSMFATSPAPWCPEIF